MKNITLKRLLIYLGLSFGITWAVFFLFILTGNTWTGSSNEMISFISLAMLVPAIAHVLTRLITREKMKLAGEDSMMLGIHLGNRRGIFYLIAIFLPIVYGTLSDAILILCDPGIFDPEGVTVFYAIAIPLISIVSGVILSFAAFGEEFGWRAYMMPKLIELMGMPRAVIVGGIVWGLWHAPMTCVGHNFGMDYPGFPVVGILLMCLMCTAMGTVLTYVTVKSGSVWPAAFMHAVNNAGASCLVVFLRGDIDHPIWVSALCLIPIVICGIIFFFLLPKSRKS